MDQQLGEIAASLRTASDEMTAVASERRRDQMQAMATRLRVIASALEQFDEEKPEYSAELLDSLAERSELAGPPHRGNG